MVEKITAIQGFFAFLTKNERAVYYVIIAVIGYLYWNETSENRKLYGTIYDMQSHTIEHERKKAAIFEDIVNQQIRQQMLRDQMLQNSK